MSLLALPSVISDRSCVVGVSVHTHRSRDPVMFRGSSTMFVKRESPSTRGMRAQSSNEVSHSALVMSQVVLLIVSCRMVDDKKE